MNKEQIKKDFGIISIKEKHFEKFNKEPYVIGMFWNNQEQLILNIEKAIKENKPYNEYELLSNDEKKAFDNEELLF